MNKNKFEFIAKVKAEDFNNDTGSYKEVAKYYIKNEWYPVFDTNAINFYLATKDINLPEDYVDDVTKYFEIHEPMVDIECFRVETLCKKEIPEISQLPYSWVKDLEEDDYIFTRYNDQLVMFIASQKEGDLTDKDIRFEEALEMLQKSY